MREHSRETASRQVEAALAQALALHERGELQAAERIYRQILDQLPDQPDALHYLGLAAHQAGFTEDALRLMRRSLVLRPESAQFHNNLGAVLRQLAQPEDALRHHQKAVELEPSKADAWMSLGLASRDCGNMRDATRAFRRAIELQPAFFAAHTELANTLRADGNLEASAKSYRAALELAPDDPRAHNNLGIALRDIDAQHEAETCFTRALELDPACAEALHNLGTLRADQGHFEQARALYARALAADPELVEAYVSHAAITKLEADAPELRALTEIAENLDPAQSSRATGVHYALGKAYDDLGEYTRAFSHYLEGARHKRSQLRYSARAQQKFFTAMKKTFSTDFMARFENGGSSSDLPIFIIGMPRSGTTLVEQILASHPQVHGAGELRLLRNLVHERLGADMEDADVPAGIAHFAASDFAEIGDAYTATLRARAPGARHITDKMPPNMMLVGLIHLALPKARIIHCRRDPLDTCVSCFSKLFGHGHHFSYDLAELGEFYTWYQDLMAHWQAILPTGRMLEVAYEDIVADTAGEAQRIIAHCGLEWDDACLRFHETARSVKTASLYQVRQPIYTGSVGRWRRYRDQLAPLIAALAGKTVD